MKFNSILGLVFPFRLPLFWYWEVVYHIFTHARTLSHFSSVQLCATPWTATHQALLSMEFSRQEYWSVLPFPSPGNLPDPGTEPGSPVLLADSLPRGHKGSIVNLYS